MNETRFLKKSNILLVITLLNTIAFGQLADPRTDTRGISTASSEDIQRRRNEGEGVRQAMQEMTPSLSFMFEPSPARKLEYAKTFESNLLNGNQDQLLAPAEYYTKYSAPLKDRRMELARIYPDKNCFSEKTVSVEKAERCAETLPIWGDGSFYSFRLKTNINQKFNLGTASIVKADRADIHYINGRLSAGGETTQGLIAEISNNDFETLNKKSREITSLKQYKPETALPEVEKQKEILRKGIQLDGYNYSDSAPAQLNSTYLLRSIAYKLYAPAQRFNKDRLELLNRVVDRMDLRIDTIIVFKIVGQEKDGSLIILWRELSRKDAPVLKGLFK